MGKGDKGYGKTFTVPEYKSSTLADAATMSLVIEADHEYVAIDAMAAGGTLNLIINDDVSAGATLELKVTSDATARTLTLGTGTCASVVYGIASQSKYLFLEYDGTTYNLKREYPERLQTTFNVGAAATGSTAVEHGDARNHVTVLTVSTTMPAIAGSGNYGIGKLVYTFPAGVVVIQAAYMSMAMTAAGGLINSDQPDGGIGTTIGTGTEALLGTIGAATENILTGQTFNNCTGTAEVKTVSDQILTIETGGDHTVYFNVADGWAGAEAACPVAGTIKLIWTFLG